MAKNKNRVPHRPEDRAKSTQEQGRSSEEQVESGQGTGKMERKRQSKKFGHN
ncbi:hypothetical protein MTQ01_10270 [Streptomyces sp. XM4193]|uniref:hypothetical protein n=1 Tax=Streptomyces sp. XM4193 TaxID=2929782 RepID=UPI001FF99F7A|nr:hypothetical protein [Streptomyces sp. XM4193]MCK1796385.1 hypothetical protein [Streptomyces sp. XM4193]